MKLSELREAAAKGYGLMRLNKTGESQELVADIDRELIDLEVAVRREERDAKQEQGWGAPGTETRQALTARLRAQEEFAQTLRRVLDETRKRIEALEAGKRGETAGYQEQNARIAALETQSDLHQQAHNMVHDRLNAQQHRMGEHHQRIDTLERELEEEDRAQKARIHTCEQELARLGKLANDNIAMHVKLGNTLKQRIENIERGVTSPAQLVPDMLKRVQRIEMSMETCVRIGDLQFRKATEA
jgi:chromosome segregation ATPase